MLQLNQKLPIWKHFKLNYTGFFTWLGKAGVNLLSNKYREAVIEGANPLGSLSRDAQEEEVATLLLKRALIQAICNLIHERRHIIGKYVGDIEVISAVLERRLRDVLTNQEMNINEDFFRNSAAHPIVKILIDPLTEWLVSYGFADQDAKETANALPIYFVHALNEEWARHPDNYLILFKYFQERITTPFTTESLWLRYSAWLKKRVDEPILGESFGLSRILYTFKGSL